MDEFPSGTNMIVAVLAYTGRYLDLEVEFLGLSLTRAQCIFITHKTLFSYMPYPGLLITMR